MTGECALAQAQQNVTATSGVADRAAVRFSIPAQPLAPALASFGNAADLQILYTADVARNMRTNGVQGTFSRGEALRRLLAGTGLVYRFTNAGTVTIERTGSGAAAGPVSGAISLDTIDVQGETAWGPVQGYVASRSATATKTDTPIIEVPQSISVVTRDQMQTRQVQSLNETLRYTPGVYAEPGGLQLNAGAVQMRGFIASPYQGSVYLNGLRSLTNGDVEPYGLERVEVLRGPASVLYGQNQPGGVIGLVTKRPSETLIHEVQLRGGSFDNKAGAFDFGGPATQDRTLLYRFTGLLREGGNGIDFSNDRRAFVSGTVTWRPTDSTEITAFSMYQNDTGKFNFGLPAQGTALPNPNGRIPITRFIGEPDFTYDNKKQAIVGYNLEHHATDSVTFRQNLQYVQEDWAAKEISPRGLQADLRTLNRGAASTRWSWDTFVIDNQAELKATTGILQHTVLFGVDHRWRKSNVIGTYSGTAGPIDVFAPIYGSPVFIPADNYGYRQAENFTGVYLQDQIKLDRWILTLGGRHDWTDSKTVNAFGGTTTNQNASASTKRGGLGYEFESGVVPYISYSESFVPTSGTAFDGSPFKPTTGIQYEGGIKFQPKDMNLRMTAAVYDLRQQNVLTTDPGNPRFSIQTGEIASRGFEFEAVASLTSNLNLTAAYAYNDTKVTKSTTANLGKRPVTIPPHLASLWADYTIREGALNGLGFGGGIRYVAASAGDSLNTFDAPAYTVVDAMVRYEIDTWRFSVNVTNLFDTQYVAGCFSLVQCNVGRTRTVLGTVTYRW
ncbi:TonB-dependent siderophore receptor [Nitrobacter sp.]|uniref:TonB-dependent siderophore receptor n=1 Tax=unclassified Nitrobacter TaxID=2620411 RepID=UPI0032203601